ncbi:unnamed protein product, partial [Brassica oleracea]
MCSEQKNFKEPTVIESTGIDILLDEESCDLRLVSLVAADFGVGVSLGGCVSVVWLTRRLVVVRFADADADADTAAAAYCCSF